MSHRDARVSGRVTMGIRVRASAFAHPKSPHVAAVNERQFVSALQLVLPRKMDDGDGNASTSSEGFADVSEALRRRPRGSNDGVNVPLELVGPAPGGDDFRVARMTLAQLVDENFLAQHVRPESGARLFACPLDGRLDGDDVAAITPSGHLRASLTPFTHARAGVTGAKRDRGTLKHEASVHLAKKDFVPGAPFRDRLVGCLRQLDEEGGDGVVGGGWYACACERVADGEPLAVSFPHGVVSEGRRITRASRTVRWSRGDSYSWGDSSTPGPPTPPVEFFRRDGSAMDVDDDGGVNDDTDTDVASSLAGFHEWIGAVACGCEGGDVGEDGDAVTVGEAHRWEGLLTPRMVRSALEFCIDKVAGGDVPWAAVTSWGFPEDPTRAGLETTFAVLPGGRYLMFSDT